MKYKTEELIQNVINYSIMLSGKQAINIAEPRCKWISHYLENKFYGTVESFEVTSDKPLLIFVQELYNEAMECYESCSPDTKIQHTPAAVDEDIKTFGENWAVLSFPGVPALAIRY